ncbi:TRAP transporter substrate-binding protein [Paracoccus tibetensis]|uniref:Tripartite ATP-independent transporter solute receptor, DctP family n=1 Tax=Paracoccus tibetensis TaxID=336292 RepID=A0A1G5HNK7_9RHOB|nr:TRAP transporter substrate-binding protein [Paracoccus tibetensis]SCY65343.1 tripartite ATP-independent transporter solute receptor, DctP family [Paracoccus tibetensis]
MKLMNPAVLAAATAMAAFLSTAASAQTVIRVGHGAQAGHPTHLGLLRLSEIVAERTDGEVQIEVFADRQLGEEREMVEGLQLGTVDMTVVSTGPLNAFVPEIAVLDLPFLFRDSQHAYGVLDGEVGQEILAKFEGAGILGLGYFENGWRHLTTKGAVDAREDLQGVKLRTMQNPVHMAAFEAMGASPVPMAWGEVFTSLGQGVIDAQENPITVIYTNSLWEVQSHVTLTGHVYGPHVILASQVVWDGLPEDARTAISEAMPEVIAFQRQESQRLEAEQIDLLRDKGMTVSDVDPAPFREAAQAVYSQFSDRFDPSMLERIQAQ